VSAFILALALLGSPSVKPWPVGPGPRYRPAPRPAAGLRCTQAGTVFQVHVEIFANRKVVILPAGIGAGPGCSYPLRTVDPTGVVDVRRGSALRVADLFHVWGQALGTRRIASFSSSSPLRAYVDGKRIGGPAGAIRLTPHSEIVLELGAYVPPHPFFLFPGGRP